MHNLTLLDDAIERLLRVIENGESFVIIEALAGTVRHIQACLKTP